MTKPSEGYSYDPACEGIAEFFLGTNPDRAHVEELAQVVQDAIEDWIGDRDRRAEAAWERQQQSLMESSGPDDSAYRRDVINAGRGHLLR